ncbi:DUF2934 domain-containing protein [Mesorhizobium sp. B1-1-8]|uniref:DUF2934 domain-containing protein n=1 Tax=Mesorhizobium sp. B1-1-8 TaxID=2589976 RepID=UPI00112717EF|nr:DUF2934 domain-containing protein [Mesorhizobium sp. B1-1-8]UCI10352.1 DUF2934 domain-containing protein [Mesorhizobium sp. B1-1-8]
MAQDKYERIRRRAYEIWQRSGELHGHHEEHWNQASTEIDREDYGLGEQPGAAMPGAATIPSGQPHPQVAEALARKARMAGDQSREPAKDDSKPQNRNRRTGI